MAATEVLGVGVAGWDGGTDLFLDLARRLAARTELTFRWSGRRSSGSARWLDADADLIGLGDRIRWSEEPAVAGTTVVAVVPARTAAARDAAIAELDRSIPVLAFALASEGRPGSAELVDFPDTAALAERIGVLAAGGSR